MNYQKLDVEPVVVSRPLEHGVMTKTISYSNNTGIPLYVTENHGGSFILEPKRNRVISPNAIEIFVTYKVPAGVANLTMLAESFSDVVYRNMCSELRQYGETTLMYVVDDPVPILRGEAVVLSDLGLAFSNQPIGINRTPIAKTHGDRTTLTLGVIIVQRYDDPKFYQWVRYYTTMVKAESVRSKYYEPGVYMVMMSGEIAEGGRLVHFGFDDPLSPFRIFETEEQAKTFRWMSDAIPDLSAMRQQLADKIKEVDRDLATQKAQLEQEHRQRMNDLAFNKEEVLAEFRTMELRQKQQADERKDVIEERSLARKDTFDERSTVRKDKSEERKDTYDQRSMVRKDGSDFLKAIPTYLAAGMALLAIMK
ncbi:hypothetical protein BIZ78_gp196 [Erwinia phage vB_EamM_Caitlin]|uniref:hypothetical protein n=1 Tax=Erwinia phage vB_EamM_Caitlin TaxID=1883379 RepID=UPI00081CF545|nr:hypothetical protein BIZ78_gp196 [Erwinia phage vB_EamM_Caitlin]ANZ48379.1 hypothetical protein CAITLIN_84 [Erwinia phage vB_EamM_Caitlin]